MWVLKGSAPAKFWNSRGAYFRVVKVICTGHFYYFLNRFEYKYTEHF